MKTRLNHFLKNIPYRINYYIKTIYNFFGFCDRCFSRVNVTRAGRCICPQCGK